MGVNTAPHFSSTLRNTTSWHGTLQTLVVLITTSVTMVWKPSVMIRSFHRSSGRFLVMWSIRQSGDLFPLLSAVLVLFLFSWPSWTLHTHRQADRQAWHPGGWWHFAQAVVYNTFVMSVGQRQWFTLNVFLCVFISHLFLCSCQSIKISISFHEIFQNKSPSRDLECCCECVINQSWSKLWP